MDAVALTRAPPLRIANVMLGRRLGGLEQAALDYHDALSRIGHDVHTVIDPHAAIRGGLEGCQGTWHGLAHWGEWDIAAAMRLRVLLRRLGPDVCIAHGNRAMRLLHWASADPVVAVLPNYKMTCRGAAAVFYPTLDLRRYAQAQGVAENRLYHVPSMVEVPPSLPTRTPGRPPVIGAMGRFVEKKGFDVYLAALAVLRSSGAAFRAVLAGDGPEGAALERLAVQHGLTDVLTFPGWVDDKSRFFAGIDLFCVPSHHEPFGIVVIEAMAQGVPVIATTSEGPSEILRDGLDGVLVPRAAPALLAQALGALITEPERAVRLAVSAYRRVRVEYDRPRVAERIERALRRIALTGSRRQVEVTA